MTWTPRNDQIVTAGDKARTRKSDDLAAFRAERNARLAASDIAVAPDVWDDMTKPQKQAWKAYRKALRDLPATTEDPAAPVWPVAPKA